MPTTSVLFLPYFCFRSTESFIFFLSISKYLNYIYLIDLCCVGAEKAVQILIKMEDVWNFSPFLVQWGAHPGNECSRGSVSPISCILGAMSPFPPLREQKGSPSVLEGARVQAISQLKATSGFSSDVLERRLQEKGAQSQWNSLMQTGPWFSPCVRQSL